MACETCGTLGCNLDGVPKEVHLVLAATRAYVDNRGVDVQRLIDLGALVRPDDVQLLMNAARMFAQVSSVYPLPSGFDPPAEPEVEQGAKRRRGRPPKSA